MTVIAELYSALVRDASALHVTPDADTVLSRCPANSLSIFFTTGFRDLVPPLVCIKDHMLFFFNIFLLDHKHTVHAIIRSCCSTNISEYYGEEWYKSQACWWIWFFIQNVLFTSNTSQINLYEQSFLRIFVCFVSVLYLFHFYMQHSRSESKRCWTWDESDRSRC